MKNKTFIASAVLSFLLVSLAVGAGAQSVKTETDIVFRNVDGEELKLDVYSPDEGGGPYPTLVFIFGVGFYDGSRTSWYYALPDAVRHGYVAVALEYRLTSKPGADGKPKYPFPCQVEDVKYAVRWLRANAGKYRVDPERIAAIGFSAGGNLALMLGLTSPADGLEGTGLDEYSSGMDAVVSLAGSNDLTLNHKIVPTYMEALLGGPPEKFPERYRAASPISYVRAGLPPVLTIVGDKDPLLAQERTFDAAMKAAGASHELRVLPGVSHSMATLFNRTNYDAVWEFLDKSLGGKR